MSDHGTRARYLRGCKCDPCADAHRRYVKAYKHRTKAHPLTGIPAIPTRVDVQPVRDHIARLLASGWTKAQIQREAGLASSHISHITLGHYPTTNRRIADAILGIDPLEPVTVDDVAVERWISSGVDWHGAAAVIGRRPTREERVEAARRMDRRGISRAAIAEATGLRSETLYAEVYGRVAS